VICFYVGFHGIISHLTTIWKKGLNVLYILLFLEGVITFISPCLLPLLPVYVSYFAGGDIGNKSKPLINAIAFVLGFTLVFVILGAFAGAVGAFLITYSRVVEVGAGLVIVMFGLNYLGLIKIGLINKTKSLRYKWVKNLNFYSAFVFGIVFSIAWTPCVSTFLAAALMRAAAQGSTQEGMLMLFVYSMGLGLPFIACAVLINNLKKAFVFIKNNYRTINIVSGILLVLIGILMVTGIFSSVTRWLS